DICNDFDVFLALDICDEDFIIEASEGNKLYFKGTEQEKIFKLLKNNDLLSEFTIFDLFKFEYKKFDIIGSGRLYYPGSIEI
ncbi:MAG: hypothetical protein GQ534_05050, partial [Candidatus Delongbacteria bacterium]|nr:hypothetical protein [Candidatus Delongbacteria bacterium]